MTAGLRNPVAFIRSPPYLWIVAVYGSTYVTVNLTRTMCGVNEIDPVAPTLVASTCVNMYLGVMKDRW